MKSFILIGIAIILVISISIIKDYFSPKKFLEKYDKQIESLEKELKYINTKITKNYKKENKQFPLYYFLKNNISKDLSLLFEEQFKYEKKLSYIFRLKGDYFLKELFFSDKNTLSPYKKYKIIDPIVFLSKLKNNNIEATDYLTMLIKTRQIALKYYNLALKIVHDYSSFIYKVNNNIPFIEPLPLILIKNGGEEDLIVDRLVKDSNFRLKYHSYRVNPILHHSKGKVYYQLANLFFLQRNKDNLSKIKNYLDQSEKEYLICLGVDKYYLNVVYDLARLYLWRYEKFQDYNKEYFLLKIEFLIRKYVLSIKEKKQTFIKNSIGKNLTRKVLFSLSPDDYIASLFILGRVYYHIALLSKNKIANLIRINPLLINNKKNLIQKTKIFFIDKAINIYQNRLMGKELKENSDSYQNAYENLRILRKLKNNLKL